MGEHLQVVWDWLKGAVRRSWGWVGKRLSAVGANVDILSLLLFAVVGGLTLAHTNKFPKKETWEGGLLPALQVIFAAALAATQLGVVIQRRRNQRNLQMEDACRQVASYIDHNCPELPLRHVGVHIWVVSGPFFARYLRRKAKFLLIGERAQSGIRWTRGKGVVGAAWHHRNSVVKNLDGIRERAQTQEQYDALPAGDRLGLNWGEFQMTPRYAAIYASPLFDRSKTSANPDVRGVLAVDILQRGHFRALKKATHSPDFASIVGVCETALTSSEGG